MDTKDFYQQRKLETPFQLIEEDPWIACVGENGGTDDYDIFIGFGKTVGLIMESLKCRNYYEDEMIYPMAFAARHAVELGLKISIRNLLVLVDLDKMLERRVSIDKTKVDKDLRNHDIERLTKNFVSLLKIDSRLLNYADIQEYLTDYFFDKNSDMFRYAENKVGDKNLVVANVSQVGMTHLYKRFSHLFSIFNNLIINLDSIVEEYKQGTYTTKLSRYELELIAKELPDKELWKEECFDEKKEQIKQKCGLSSRKLSEAIDCIKSNSHLCSYIGMEIKLVDIPESELIKYVDLVFWYKEEMKDDQELKSLETYEDIIVEQPIRNKKIEEKSGDILFTTLESLDAFSIIGHDNIYAEKFHSIYESVTESNFARSYLIGKLKTENIFDCVRKGLKECGQLSYLRIIEDRMDEIGFFSLRYSRFKKNLMA